MCETEDKEWTELSPSDPNLPPKEMLRLLRHYPREVLANPMLPLLALEDPALWHRITVRARLKQVEHEMKEGLSRLGEEERRLWACDCAERVLPRWEHRYPEDLRPRKAIEVSRAYAQKETTEKERKRARDEAEGAAWGPSCPERTAACAALWAVTSPADCERTHGPGFTSTDSIWATLHDQYQNPAQAAASWASRAVWDATDDVEKHFLEKKWQFERLAWYLTTF